ncbi:NAD(P)-dependent oxidoreductase [Lactococcus nasutitermitis]|uniref:NAD(P)-dependent oxidoreductase n=1 Tax=Lactococcus nasutitermitis TaxID=1652957 RepID=A0ABV9JD66_9LACT|nr:NAD(P)H-binding protein [Lactococcus nasutitermitis]
MTKIAVIGATGKSGSLIAKKALTAGFDVTAIVRNAKKLTIKPQAVIEKDVFNLTNADLLGFDAIVLAFRAKAGDESSYSRLFEHLIEILTDNPARLIIVGGAGSLYTDESRATKYVETFPKDLSWVAEPREMAKASELIKASKLNYTFFSPAATFLPEGVETGNYTLTNDVFQKNSAGKSEISYADFAAAVIKIIKEGSYEREHIGIYQN